MRKSIIERKKEVKLRKNFLPTFVITSLLWLGLFSVIYFIDPQQAGAVVILLLITFFTLFFTMSIIFINSRRGLISSLGIVVFLVLRLYGLGNILNFFLIFGICITVEIYFIKKSN